MTTDSSLQKAMTADSSLQKAMTTDSSLQLLVSFGKFKNPCVEAASLTGWCFHLFFSSGSLWVIRSDTCSFV
jgi:hypothetical protein